MDNRVLLKPGFGVLVVGSADRQYPNSSFSPPKGWESGVAFAKPVTLQTPCNGE